MSASGSTYIVFVISLVLFGSNGVVADGISLSSAQIVLMRTLLGSLMLAAALLVLKDRRAFGDSRQRMYLAVSGAAMGISWILLYEAYLLSGVGLSSVLYYCGPAIVMALSPFVFGEKLTAASIAGFAAVLAGSVMLCAGPSSSGDSRGYLLAAGSAVCHAVMIIFSKKADRIGGLENSAMQLAVSFLTVLIYLVATSGVPDSIEAEDWPRLLMLGFANTGLGCLLYFSAIVKLKAQTVAISGYLEPLTAVVLAMLLLGEDMSAMQWAGVALVIAGAAYSETRRNGAGGLQAPGR